MSSRRFDGTNFIDTTSYRRFDGSNWVDVSTIKRKDITNDWFETLKEYSFVRGTSIGISDAAISESSVTPLTPNRVRIYAKKSNITGMLYFVCPQLTFPSSWESNVARLRVKCRGINNTSSPESYLVMGTFNAITKGSYKYNYYPISNSTNSDLTIECSLGMADTKGNTLMPFFGLNIPSSVSSATIEVEIEYLDLGFYRYGTTIK